MGKKFSQLVIAWLAITLITLGIPNIFNLCIPSVFRYVLLTLLIVGWLLGASALLHFSYIFLTLITKELDKGNSQPSISILFIHDKLTPEETTHRKKLLKSFLTYLIIFATIWLFAYLNSQLSLCHP